MRCRSCNEALTDDESTRKGEYGEFIDLCGYCYTVSEKVKLDAYEEDPAIFSGVDEYE